VNKQGVAVGTAGEVVEVIDQLSPARFEMEVAQPIDLRATGSEAMSFPVDMVYTAEMVSIRLSMVVQGYIRGPSGEVRDDFGYETSVRGDGEPAVIEFNTPLKMYLQTPRLERIETSSEETVVEFGQPVEVQIGVRSNAEQPAGEISITDDPRDLLAAINQFRSAMRVRTPERSYPTLRGHPPTIRVGETFSVPDHVLAVEDSDIRIEAPPTFETAYVIAPLAYYLSAEVRPGPESRLVTSDGFEYPLEGSLDSAVHRVLTQTFVLDCYTRSAGLRPTKVAWHAELAGRLPSGYDPVPLFNLAPGKLLERYLAVDYETVAPFVPEWSLTAHVAPEAKNAAALPHLIDQLALVQAFSGRPVSGTDARRAALSTFVGGDETRGPGTETSIFEQATFTEIPATDSTAAVWIGDEIPIGANHGVLDGYVNRHSHTRTGEAVSVSIICNEQTMDGEATRLDEIYQQRDILPFETAVHADVTTDRLRTLLAEDVDFLHYIGHATSTGLECVDGTLDPDTLETCGATTFCLNACQSYLPARALIERGAVAGVATLGDIVDDVAQGFGTATARLLNQGFCLRAAVYINRQASLLGGAYLVLGDESVALAETDGIVPYSIHLPDGESPSQVSFRTYPSGRRGMGTFVTTNFDDEYYLCNGEIGPFEPTEEAFERFLSLHEAPILRGDELLWSSDVTVGDL
jgi:hypothetical protein